MNQSTARNGIIAGGVGVALVLAFMLGRSSVTIPPATQPSVAAVQSPSPAVPADRGVESPAPAAEPARTPPQEPAVVRAPDAPQRPIAAARIAAANGAAAPAAGNPVTQGLTLARRNLERARRALQGATADNHGGYVEKARADAEAAVADLAAAIAFADAHPEVKDLPPETSAESDAAIHRTKLRTFPTPNNQANMVTALEALQTTMDAVQQAGGAGLGGSRDKLIADLDRAATNIATGFDFLQKGGIPKATDAPAGPPPAALP